MTGTNSPAAPRVVAAVDCGTNSTRLLVVRRGDDGGLVTIERLMRITRLGQGVDSTGRLAPDAIGRTTDVLAEYRTVLERHGATEVRATATSAARDVTNREDFFGPATAALGSRPELLAGDEEGRLSFLGATADLPAAGGPYLVADIGGGSTELVVGTFTPGGRPEVAGVTSLDVGCVRVTERHLHHDPPTDDELDEAAVYLGSRIASALDDLPGARGATLLGLAGTVSTVAAVEQGLATYDRDRIHHAVLTRAAIEAVTDRLAALTVAARAQVPGVEPGRAEVIVGGCLVLRALVEAAGVASLVVSEADILDGLAMSLLGGSVTPPVRLIATDLDGTLLGSDDRISERTLAALAAARLAGVHVVAATGRSHRTAVPLIGPSGHIDVAICSNGATIYDVVGGRVEEQHPVTAEAAAGMFAAIGEQVPGASFGWESVDGFGWSPGFLDAEPEVGETIEAVAGAAGPKPAAGLALLKVFVAHPEITHDALLAAVAAALPPGLTVTHSGARSVEVTAEGVDKAAALARVCARFGIGADEVVAFGDNQNDLEMLRWAGRGVAMDNAHPAVLAEFSERAGHHADDGVAIAIELLLAAAPEARS